MVSFTNGNENRVDVLMQNPKARFLTHMRVTWAPVGVHSGGRVCRRAYTKHSSCQFEVAQS